MHEKRDVFPAGTFTPDPRPNAVRRMLAAQSGLELKLLLRNGEQLLLTMFIPITLLVGLTLLPFGSFGQNRAATFVPVIMALAVISTAFTGQAIAVAFDRRYGALKRLGATPLPVWGIIAGKSLAVVAVVFLQAIILGVIGFALGWRPAAAALALGAAIIASIASRGPRVRQIIRAKLRRRPMDPRCSGWPSLLGGSVSLISYKIRVLFHIVSQ